MVGLGAGRLTLFIEARSNALSLASALRRAGDDASDAMSEGNRQAAAFVAKFFDEEARRITGSENFWPVRSQVLPASAHGSRIRVGLGRTRPHWIHPTKEHGILANRETGFFARGSVWHPGSKPVDVLTPLAQRRVRTLRGFYRGAVTRSLGLGPRSAFPSAGGML